MSSGHEKDALFVVNTMCGFVCLWPMVETIASQPDSQVYNENPRPPLVTWLYTTTGIPLILFPASLVIARLPLPASPLSLGIFVVWVK